jgi:hypothetical protein
MATQENREACTRIGIPAKIQRLSKINLKRRERLSGKRGILLRLDTKSLPTRFDFPNMTEDTTTGIKWSRRRASIDDAAQLTFLVSSRFERGPSKDFYTASGLHSRYPYP